MRNSNALVAFVFKNKKADIIICRPYFFAGAPDRNRTGTLSLTLDFESSASTNSATGAVLIFYTIINLKSR